MAKYRIVEKSNNKDNETTYTVQERLLWIFWITVEHPGGFGIYSESIFINKHLAVELKEKLEFDASKKYTKKVL